MQINPKIKKQLRWQNNIFVLLFLIVIGLLAWLSLQYEFEADWTNNQRNTPSEASLALLEKIAEPIVIQSFVSDTNKALKEDIAHLIQGYQRFKSNITLGFIDPTLEPALVRKHGIRNEGELLINMDDRQEHILAATEKNITNAIQRLARTQNDWLLFLSGHDERSPHGDSSFDYTSLNTILKNKGLLVRTYNLASNPNIPENTAALVIADPQKPLLDGEIQIILNYIDRGGNLLWLLEPNSQQNMDSLADVFGIDRLPGIVVDPNTEILGLTDQRFTLIPEYSRHVITQNLDSMTVYPTSQALEFIGNDDWEAETLLETLPRTWSETDEISPDMSLDSSLDTPGPLVIGLSLTRSVRQNEFDFEELANLNNIEQRIVIIGDSDFASNAYLGQGGNLDITISIINWLVKEDAFVSIPNRTNLDGTLNLSKTEQMIIGFSFLLIIPVGLMLTGLIIWFKRRKS